MGMEIWKGHSWTDLFFWEETVESSVLAGSAFSTCIFHISDYKNSINTSNLLQSRRSIVGIVNQCET
jgi:hypothetical protein